MLKSVEKLPNSFDVEIGVEVMLQAHGMSMQPNKLFDDGSIFVSQAIGESLRIGATLKLQQFVNLFECLSLPLGNSLTMVRLWYGCGTGVKTCRSRLWVWTGSFIIIS